MKNFKKFFRWVYLSFESFLLRFKRKKDVLFLCANELMFNYAYMLYEVMAKDERMRFWFCYLKPQIFSDFQKVKQRSGLKWIAYKYAKNIKWDLVLCPDHALYFRPGVKKFYTEHGLASGKMVGGHPYLFGPRSLDENGRVIYDKIFVSSHLLKSKLDASYPEFSPHLQVVGSLLADQILVQARQGRLGEYDRLGFDPAKKTIMIASSWGENSLVQSQGVALIDQVNNLMRAFNIILSLHILNFTRVPYKGVDLQSLLISVKKGTIYVTRPEEGGSSYLHLADLLVTDMTSLGLYYPILGRPIVYVENPKFSFSSHSMLHELRKVAYVEQNIQSLESDIPKAFAQFDPAKMAALADKIFSFQGSSDVRHREEILESLGLISNNVTP